MTFGLEQWGKKCFIKKVALKNLEGKGVSAYAEMRQRAC